MSSLEVPAAAVADSVLCIKPWKPSAATLSSIAKARRMLKVWRHAAHARDTPVSGSPIGSRDAEMFYMSLRPIIGILKAIEAAPDEFPPTEFFEALATLDVVFTSAQLAQDGPDDEIENVLAGDWIGLVESADALLAESLPPKVA